MSTTVQWVGASGQRYDYECYAVPNNLGSDVSWNDVPGNYIFAGQQNGLWVVLYVGETGSFQSRLTSQHERWQCARNLGVTHVHARVNTGGPTARRNEENDLVQNLNPVCNGR